MNTAAHEIKSVITQVFKNWSSMKPDSNDPLYMADDKTVLFDIEPMQDIGWQSQKNRLQKVFSNFETFRIAPNEDINVHQSGNLAWATMTWTYEILLRDGKRDAQNGRATFVLENRAGRWLVVHDHVSRPTT